MTARSVVPERGVQGWAEAAARSLATSACALGPPGTGGDAALATAFRQMTEK